MASTFQEGSRIFARLEATHERVPETTRTHIGNYSRRDLHQCALVECKLTSCLKQRAKHEINSTIVFFYVFACWLPYRIELQEGIRRYIPVTLYYSHKLFLYPSFSDNFVVRSVGPIVMDLKAKAAQVALLLLVSRASRQASNQTRVHFADSKTASRSLEYLVYPSVSACSFS